MSNIKADNILNSAKKLFLRFGYDKTSVADIANEAGVSKGGIYLYFKSKDDIMEKLMLSEMYKHNERWIDLVMQDPEGGLLSGMYKNQLKAMVKSETIMSILKKDVDVLGSYLKKQDSLLSQDVSNIRVEFIKMLQGVNCVKKDVDPKIVAHIMDMLELSLITIADNKSKENLPSITDVIEQIAYIMEKAYAPEDGGDSEAGKQVLLGIYNPAKEAYLDGKSESISNQ